MSSVTHAINTDQRRLRVASTSEGGDRYKLEIPSLDEGLIPGNYMLFALGPTDTPSLAKTINIR